MNVPQVDTGFLGMSMDTQLMMFHQVGGSQEMQDLGFPDYAFSLDLRGVEEYRNPQSPLAEATSAIGMKFDSFA